MSTYFQRAMKMFKKLYLTAFPAVERLPYFPLVLNAYRRLANFYAYYDKDDFVGLVYLLENEEVIYHFLSCG